MNIPLLLVGDGPHEPTGLSRIARHIASGIAGSSLPLDLVQIGGTVPPVWDTWRHYPLDRAEDWGAACVREYWHELFGDRPGILWVVWDPGRLIDYANLDLPVEKWAYTAIDAANWDECITGPAGQALKAFDRVLGYGRWGSYILKRSLQHPVSYLPHGIQMDVWATPVSEDELTWARAQLGPYLKPNDTIIGCVMTNQFRKDHGTFFQMLRELNDRGRPTFGWLHTDEVVKKWAIPQLVEDFNLQKRVRISLTGTWNDRQLAAMYQICHVTALPTLGEGFGYPIVESLAAGTPCVHGDCAGGAELVPKTEWRVPVALTRLDGLYGHVRPVWKVEDWANAVERTLRWREAIGPEVCAAYCRGSVAHLDWRSLWPRWESWIRKGLAA